MRTPSQCPHRPSVQGGKKRLQDTTHAIPNYREDFRTTRTHTIPASTPSQCPGRDSLPVIFWHWRMAQKYANSLLIKLLRALLGYKTRIT